MAFVNVNFKKLYCGDLNCSDKELRLKTGGFGREKQMCKYLICGRAVTDRGRLLRGRKQPVPWPALAGPLIPVVLIQRQGKDKLCAHAFCTDYVDIFVVNGDNFSDNGKAQSGAPLVFSAG